MYQFHLSQADLEAKYHLGFDINRELILASSEESQDIR